MNTRFNDGDIVRYRPGIEKYAGGSNETKARYAKERLLFKVMYKESGNYVVKNEDLGQWYGDDDCLVPANKPTIIIKRK